MRLSRAVRKIWGKLRHTLLSRLLFTYIAIMLLMLAMQSLLMGSIYQAEYSAERVKFLQKEAADLSLIISEQWSSQAGMQSPFYLRAIHTVAKRQNAIVWVVDRFGGIQMMKADPATKGSTGDKVPGFETIKLLDEEEFIRYFNKVIRGDTVTEKGLFSGHLGSEMLTVGVPIRYQNVTWGAVFMHTKMQAVYDVIGRMYRHIATSAGVSMIIGILLISLISTRISHPLVQMNEIAGNIARGNFDKKADVKSRDEIGQLAKTFNKMAEELKKQEDLRTGFVANVSHELRSPLTSIHGFAQGMLDGTVEQKDYQKYLGVIVGETRRLNKLIRELLDLSQIESGNFPLYMQAFNINELISRVLITFEDKIVSKALEIDVDYRQEKAMVLADSDRIEQVLINLLDNAVKFTGEGGRIRIWTHGASDKILVGISDSGPGIPAEDQPYIWERFYKVDKSHTGKKGTGLGLSIVKKIIDQHGERITLQSKAGSGAVFVFSLKNSKQ